MGTPFGPGVLSKVDIVPAQGEKQKPDALVRVEGLKFGVFGDTAALMDQWRWRVRTQETCGSQLCFRSGRWGEMIATHMSRAGD